MLIPIAAAALAADPFPSPTASVADDVSPDALIATIRALPEQRSGAGAAAHWSGLVETEELVLARLRGLGYEPDRRPIAWRPRPRAAAAREPPTFHNIIVDLPGRDLPHEVLIVGAHIDAVPSTPGADDNGTGVAALLELARVLKDRPMRRTVRLIFFNLEEVGLVGSQQYVEEWQGRSAVPADVRQEWQRSSAVPADAPADPSPDAAPADEDQEAVGSESRPTQETIVGMISLEMLGYFSDEPGSQASPIPPIPGVFEPPTVGDFIAVITTRSHAGFGRRFQRLLEEHAAGLKTGIVDFAPDVPHTPRDLLRSDHAPFLAIGVPALMLTDTSNFRNPHYHAATDTVETLDAERYALVVRGVAGAVYTLAEPAADAAGESGGSR